MHCTVIIFIVELLNIFFKNCTFTIITFRGNKTLYNDINRVFLFVCFWVLALSFLKATITTIVVIIKVVFKIPVRYFQCKKKGCATKHKSIRIITDL